MDRRRPGPDHRSLDADERGDLPGAAAARVLENPEIRRPRDDHARSRESLIDFETYEARDRFLALQAPLYLIVILMIWLAALLIGFALMLWPFMRTGGLIHAITVSGSSLFTLGFAAEAGAAPRLLVFCAAAAGLTIVALQIAYLPVLYGAFNRREVLVTMLDSRAGSPAWGPELLARSELVDNVHNLASLYQRWEEWAADVAETHASYPVLLWFRSPHPYRSWVIALLAVMDAAAMQLSTQPLLAPSEARAFLRMGYMCLRDLASVVGLTYDPDPKPNDPIQLTEDNFQDAIHHLEHVGWTMQRSAAELVDPFPRLARQLRGARLRHRRRGERATCALGRTAQKSPPAIATSGASAPPRAVRGDAAHSQAHRETAVISGELTARAAAESSSLHAHHTRRQAPPSMVRHRASRSINCRSRNAEVASRDGRGAPD